MLIEHLLCFLQYCFDKAELHTEVRHQHSPASGKHLTKYLFSKNESTEIYSIWCEVLKCIVCEYDHPSHKTLLMKPLVSVLIKGLAGSR